MSFLGIFLVLERTLKIIDNCTIFYRKLPEVNKRADVVPQFRLSKNPSFFKSS